MISTLLVVNLGLFLSVLKNATSFNVSIPRQLVLKNSICVQLTTLVWLVIFEFAVKRTSISLFQEAFHEMVVDVFSLRDISVDVGEFAFTALFVFFESAAE